MIALLTVAIPTYDRPEKLIRVVRALLPQLNDRVRAVIIDNHSRLPVRELLETHVAGALGMITVIRNECNVGASANILRCFELASTDWLWILGDDDLPLPNAIETILKEMRRHPNEVFINFWSDVCEKASARPVHKSKIVDGRQLMQQVDSFSNLLFISTSIYRVELLRDSIGKAYLWCGSYAPHLAVLLVHIARMSAVSVAFSAHEIVKSGKADASDHWDYRPIALGLASLIDLLSTPSERLALGKISEPILRGAGVPLRSLVLTALGGDAEALMIQIADGVRRTSLAINCRRRVTVGKLAHLCALSAIQRLHKPIAILGRLIAFRRWHPGVKLAGLTSHALADRRT